MGIQRFGTRLSAHAQRTTLSKPVDDNTPRSTAIIDGPGLVHYVYYRLCDSSQRSNIISYGDCANETIRWLDQLRNFAFDIEAILFDGALPASKKDVRIKRLQAYVTKLQAFKQLSTTNLSSISGELRKSLPPPPFLVFAVVEALLRHSDYAAVTYVVPGEADPYCVAAAKALAAADPVRIITIFSDDADLLVYNPGENTRVITLRDLSESGTDESPTWSATEQWPGRIASSAKHPLPDLIRPAFYMSQDLHCTLEQALTKSGAPPSSPDFTAFAETFSITAEEAQWSLLKASQTLKDSLSALDSRASELVFQLQNRRISTPTTPAEGSEPTAASSAGGLRIYLPFLHDDPSRSPAWNVSTHLRILAYSILLHHFSCEDSILQEYRRSGSRIASTLLDPLAADELDSQISSLKSHVTETLEWAGGRGLGVCEAWKYYAMQVVLRYFQAEGLALPNAEELVAVLMGRKAKKWTGVHLAAQWQATFYGLRMVQQSLGVVTGDAEKICQEGLSALGEVVKILPGIVDFFAESEDQTRKSKEDLWRDIIGEFLATIRQSNENEEGKDESRPRKRAKKSKKTKVVDAELAQNPFALLAD